MSSSGIIALSKALHRGDTQALARCISIVENEAEGYEEILEGLTYQKRTPVIGITGPPGAGKSTLINVLIKELLKERAARIAVMVVDPTSPFSHGALLGDRLRMHMHYDNPNVFIRSLATRGALGGLSAKSIEVCDLMRAAGFDYILIETVGVGQSEIEVAGLADLTVLVLVPEAGDEIQTIKSGIMEIADVFVVNKADREGASMFAKNIQEMLHAGLAGRSHTMLQAGDAPVLLTCATKEEGIDALVIALKKRMEVSDHPQAHALLQAEKAYRLIQHKRMKGISREYLLQEIQAAQQKGPFNLYAFVKTF